MWILLSSSFPLKLISAVTVEVFSVGISKNKALVNQPVK